MTKYPVRESSAMVDISSALGFRRVQDYEKAVRHLLAEEDTVLEFVRSLFDDLWQKMQA